MPIKNAQGKVIGVSQLINKQDGTPFNKNDENFFEVRIDSSPLIKTLEALKIEEQIFRKNMKAV